MNEKLDPAKLEELLQSAVRLDSLSKNELPKELLAKVAGGSEEEEVYGICPRCGGTLYYIQYPDGYYIFCRDCGYSVEGFFG